MRSPRRALHVVALVAASLLLCACQSELYTGLPENEANEMLAVLFHGGMQASKIVAKDGTHTVMVEQQQFAAAVDLLRTNGLPHAKFSSINEVFAPSGLIASPMQEQARYLWALGQELSKTVSQIDGVLTARVQVVLPDNDLMKREPTPSSASVFLRYDDKSNVFGLVSQIKSLVANSVQGLSYDKVSVVMIPVPHVDIPPPQTTEVPLIDWRTSMIVVAVTGVMCACLLFGYRNSIRRLLSAWWPRSALGPAE